MPDESLDEYRLTQAEEKLDQHDEKLESLSSLRTEVEMLKETVKSNTQVMYGLALLLISSGAITALLKGVI